MSKPFRELTGFELAEAIRARKVSSHEAVEELFAWISCHESRLHAFVTFNREMALKKADKVDAALARNEAVGKLAGVPIAVKDNICTTDFPTTCSSRMLQSFLPPYDAHVVECLRREGAIIIGKTNMDEFAMGSSTENSAFGPTFNPWNVECVPGGSSGGSAAAVAANMAPFALGSDTGGSIRQPAAFCGVVGLKPTYGCISRYGLVAFASSLDQIGPITKDVRDSALLLEVLCNHDRNDSTSVAMPAQPYVAITEEKPDSISVGIPKEYFGEGLAPEIASSLQSAIQVLEKLGAQIVNISLPHTKYAVPVYYIIAPAEASSNLARYDGVHYGYRTSNADDIVSLFARSRAEGFGPEVQRRILLGTHVLSSGYYDAYYLKASKVRRLIKQDFDAAFEKVDCIISPTSPIPAFKVGEKTASPLEMYLSDVYTISANLAGIPGISIPCGFTRDGLPIGMQIMSQTFDEPRLLQTARAYERETEWRNQRKPPL